MKRILFLASASALAMAVAGTSPAFAWMTVFDPTAVGKLGEEVGQLQQQLSVLQQSYSQITNVANSVMHPTNILGMAPGLMAPGMVNPIPQASQVMGMLRGGNLAGLGGMVSSLRNQNMIYQPQGTDPNAAWINQGATQTASAQALAQQLMAASQSRTPYIQEMMTDLNGATDIQQVEAIRGRMDAENHILATQQQQAQTLMMLASVQDQARQQQVDQMARQSADALFNDTQAMGGDTGSGAVAGGQPAFAAAPMWTPGS